MAPTSRHIGIRIDRDAGEIYEFASDPANLPAWTSGLGSSVEFVDGQWWAESPMGRVTLAFAPHNDFGVLDHHVTLPSGETVYNPMRAIALGTGCEVVFTLCAGGGVTGQQLADELGGEAVLEGAWSSVARVSRTAADA